MTFSLKDLKHLEVLAELSNQEPVKTELPNISELLKNTDEKEPSFEETVISLCSSLRSSGFDKQAEKLENQFLMFKSAEVHLYKAHNETGDDLLEFAHPKGDHKVEDAGEHFGDVETLQSQHKKILDVLSKQPTGKLATASLQKKADIALWDIAKKFHYLSDYLSRNILDKMPQGEKSPEGKNYYLKANQYYELGIKISQELNVGTELPEDQAVQLVKNRMNNDEVSQQASLSINSLASIDQFINTILSWFEDNKPQAKVSSKLNEYVKQCAKIVKTQFIGDVARNLPLGFLPGGSEIGLVDLWKRTTGLFGSIYDNAEITSEKLKILFNDNDVQAFPKAIGQIQNMIVSLDNLSKSRIDLTSVEFSANKEQIKEYIARFSDLKKNVSMLNGTLEAVYEATNKDLSAKLYNTFIHSNIMDAKVALSSLANSITATIGAFNSLGAKDESQKSDAISFEPKDVSKISPQPASLTNNLSPKKEQGISQLQNWLKLVSDPNTKMTDENRKYQISWINEQLKHFHEAKDDKTVDTLLQENKDAEPHLGK